MKKTPIYTREAHERYKSKARTKCVSIEMSNLLDKHNDNGFLTIVEFSKTIADFWIKNNK